MEALLDPVATTRLPDDFPSSLHLLASNDRRGAEVFGTDLVASLSARGAVASALALSQSANEVHLDVDAVGPSFRLRTLVPLSRMARCSDVIVAHGSSTLPAAALLPKGPPFVYRSIGDPRHWSSTGMRKTRSGMFLRRAAGVVVLWPVIADVLHKLHGVDHERIHVIPNAVDGRCFPAVDALRRQEAKAALGLDDVPVVASIGALSREKDIGLAVRAMARVDEGILLLAGDGPRRRDLEAVAADLLPGRVRFLGSVEDPATVLAASDMVLLTSRTEGLPGVLIEAAMSGLPVVTTDVGGVREIVLHGETGLVVPTRDPGGLAEAIRSVLDAPGDLGARARARCLERFDLDVVVDRWADLLQRIA